MSSNKKAFRQLFFMLFLTFATQAVTLIKLSVTAKNFGATVEMDAFNFSNSIGTFLFSFISTGITTVLIPAIVQKKNQRSMNNFITILYSVSIIVILFVVLFRENIVSTFASESESSVNFVKIACSLMLITLVSQFFNTIIGVANAVFQCSGKYNVPKVLTFLTTTLLAFLVYIRADLSIYEYAFYILITSLLNMVMHFFLTYKEGFIYKPIIDLKDPELPNMIKIFIPTMFSSGLYQLTLLIGSLISSTLGQGQISMLGYSNNIMAMINMLLTNNLMMYIYPKVAADVDKKDGQEKLFGYFSFFSAIMSLMVVGFIVVGKEAIRILYEGGEFTSSVTGVVFLCTVVYTIGLPINIMREIVYRYFYAKGDTKITFYNSITSSIFNLIASLVFSRFIGIYGIALATILTSAFSLTNILIKFKKKYSIKFNKRNVIIENLKVLIAAIITILIILFIKDKIIINNDIITICIFGLISVVVYVISLLLLRSKVYKVKL